MNSALLRFTIPLICILVSMLLFAACGGGGSKEDILEQTLDCMEENSEDSEIFEETMMMMFPSASNLEEAKNQYIYISSFASIEELEVARDEVCGGN